MKSLCIKCNNKEILNSISYDLTKIDLENIYISCKRFKLYNNIIIHCTSEHTDLFFDKISAILTDTIINFYEKKILKRILTYNYFYFNTLEKKKIIEIANNFIQEDMISREDNFLTVYTSVLDYIKKNKSIVLDGFVNFRLQNYTKNLDYIIDISVNKYITDKEYLEFINVLKVYVSLNGINSPLVHLVYCHGDSILLDKDKNIIPTKDDTLNAKYLSDITFSSNDYALNTLLNLTPKKIMIHLMDGKSDEFIDTIKLIFENRFEICSGCEICSLYKTNTITK